MLQEAARGKMHLPAWTINYWTVEATAMATKLRAQSCEIEHWDCLAGIKTRNYFRKAAS